MRQAITAANLTLLLLYPIAWLAPLAYPEYLTLISGKDISIISGISALWGVDIFLSLVVALFAVVTPYLKTMLLSAIHFGLINGSRWIGVIEVTGRLSMADVFLIAVYIVFAKGLSIGFGNVETAWGLYLFTACVLSSIAIGFFTDRQLKADQQSGAH